MAGHDTTAGLISFFIYFMAKYPQHQRKLQEEIDSLSHLLNDEHIAEFCTEAKFMLQCINESLRLFPPIYIMDKQTIEDIQLGNHFIPKDTMVSVPNIAVQRNPHIWKNPNEFDPERWTIERIKEIPEELLRFSFIPFGVGQRG